jgi:hypothetical protein
LSAIRKVKKRASAIRICRRVSAAPATTGSVGTLARM